jgi:quinol monooxygenase YgiN
MTTETVRVIANIVARRGKEAEVQSILSGMLAPTHQEPGCIQYELLHNLNNPAEFTLLEEWETQAALDEHSAASHHTKSAEAKMDSMIEHSPPDVNTSRLRTKAR